MADRAPGMQIRAMPLRIDDVLNWTRKLCVLFYGGAGSESTIFNYGLKMDGCFDAL